MFCEHYVTADYGGNKGNTTVVEVWGAVFSMPSTAMAKSRYIKKIIIKIVFRSDRADVI
jgi:hypothetical protein